MQKVHYAILREIIYSVAIIKNCPPFRKLHPVDMGRENEEQGEIRIKSHVDAFARFTKNQALRDWTIWIKINIGRCISVSICTVHTVYNAKFREKITKLV